MSKILTIQGKGQNISYRVLFSGKAEYVEVGGATIQRDDKVTNLAEGVLATGTVKGGKDAIRYEGKIISISAKDIMEIYITEEPVEPRRVVFGATVAGFPNYPPTDEALKDFVSLTDDTPAISNWFQPSEYGWLREWAELCEANSTVPMMSYEPYGGKPDSEWALSTIIAGNHDAKFRSVAQAMAAYSKRHLLRFAHEMNGNWYAWGAGVNGNTPEEYREAWKHVRNIFNAEGAVNVEWVWCPNEIPVGNSYGYADFFPGNAYVDWIGVDGYNWGGTRERSFEQIFRGPYEELLSLPTDKPIMIPEFGCAEIAADKPGWIRDGIGKQLVEDFPKVKAALYFHVIADGRDWRVNSSPESLAAYKDVVKLEGLGG
jgi:hypothetical protein